MASNHNFSHSTVHDINRWVGSFDFSTKTNFTAYKLEGIKTLRNFKIRWDFLRAAVKFWVLEDQVFQFKTAELYLTIEEFFAILGYDPSRKSVAISYDLKHREFLSDAFGLPISIIGSMIEGHMLNLHAIVSRLIDKRTYGVTDNMQKNFGLALCFMGEFLLNSGRHDFVDARTISVVSQIKDGDNPISLILAKTLLGRNSSSGKQRRSFTFVDTNPTSIKNMLLGLEMADRVDQSFVKVHFHKMTTEYSKQLVNKIVDKEAEMVVMRKQFLRDNWERHDEDNYEFKRRDRNDEVPNTKEISNQQKEKRLKTK